jgi:hypothetical protein
MKHLPSAAWADAVAATAANEQMANSNLLRKLSLLGIGITLSLLAIG